MRPYTLEVRGPVKHAEGDSADLLFEWRILDARSGDVVHFGSARSSDLAIEAGRAKVNELPRHRGVRTEKTSEPAAPPTTPIDLVRALLPVADALASVLETSTAVLTQAMDDCGADCGAVLLPDGGPWRVTAGEGLRPLEARAELDEGHWLVDTVCRRHDAVLVNNTDTARARLAGAPLASRRNLMAVPVAGGEGLLLVARRDDPPFTQGDLSRVAALGQPAASALQDALDVRLLARTLARHTQPPPEVVSLPEEQVSSPPAW